MIDIRRYTIPDQIWAQSMHMETSNGLPVYTILGAGEWWDIKNKQGWPWDRFTFNDKTVYQSVTENDLIAAPTAYKIFTANKGMGIAWGPLQYTPGDSNPLFTADSSYRRYSTCGNYKMPPENLGGPTASWFEGPYSHDFGGDLGIQMALKQVYLWGPNFPNMECNWFVEYYARVQWEKWVNGVLMQISAYNLFKPGGVPMLNFPCKIAL